ncbi:Pathogenicity cluster 5 protein d [Maublancomyces gigas]|uniref:Pathogenicity cluster 5 protein d n=1 Tax=Discina gigas TaxID=1032678 RepID=A0ABR3GQ07_9PEZI
MIIPNISTVLLASVGIASAVNAYATNFAHVRAALERRQQNNNRQGGNNANNNANNGANAALVLLAANVQAASNTNGQAAGAAAGQAASATDPANFINFCKGKTITNGLQVKGGSCNGIVMGDIPSTANMVSSIILTPQPGQDIAANTAFTVQIQVTNLIAGSFTNPANTYYAAPQALNGGKIVGHSHITIQTLGNSLTPTQPPSADSFVAFQGINDAGNGRGLLSINIAAGLPAGFYRACTMNSASNHQPVLMPIAQRGAQDDCTKFTVGKGNAANGGAANNGNAANNGAGKGAANNNNNNGQGRGGRGRGRGARA